MQTSKAFKEYLVIVNPNAGKGKGIKDWERISRLFKKNDIPFLSELTRERGHAINLVKDGIASGFRKIISVGGDGTLNEVVNGAYRQDCCRPADITIGMIPVGTGNDWGRMFGIPLVYEGSIKVIKENKVMLHDVGVISYHNGNEKETRYFLNIAGLGFEATVVKKTNAKKQKGSRKKTLYFMSLLTSLAFYRNTMADIIIDGTTTRCKVFSINVGNGRFCGGGMRQTPDALPDDGQLDITVVKSMGKLEIIKDLQMLYDGTILSHPKVDGYRSNNLRVNSDSILYAEADGESLGHTPVEFSIIPSGIQIIYGTKTIW